MAHFGKDLFKQYQARAADDKFTLVCIVHNAFSVDWMLEYGADWVKEGALRIMPISDQLVPSPTLPRISPSLVTSATHVSPVPSLLLPFHQREACVPVPL